MDSDANERTAPFLTPISHHEVPMNVQNSCVDDLDLAAYLEGRLPAEGREKVDRHLAKNAENRHTLETIQAVLASSVEIPSGDEVPESLMRKAIAYYPRNGNPLDLILAFTGNALSIIRSSLEVRIDTPLPAAALRTGISPGAGMVVMTKTFDAVTAAVYIEKRSGNSCNIALLVTDRSTQTPAKNLRIGLISQGRELDSLSLENGRVLFEDVHSGHYDILIQKNGAGYGRMTIKIT